MDELEELERLRKKYKEQPVDEYEELQRLRQKYAKPATEPLESSKQPMMQGNNAGESIPAWKSTMGGLSQAVSLGLGNRLISGGQALGDYALNRSAHAYEGVPYTGPSLSETYKNKRDELQRKYDEAQEQNPKSYLGGSFAGGAAMSALPGANALKTMLGAAAVQGLGESKADWTLENAGELAKDVGIGVGASAGGHLVGKGLGKAADYLADKPVEKFWAGISSFGADLPYEVGRKIIQNPEFKKVEAKGNIALAEGVADRVNDLAKQLRYEGNQAWEALENTTTKFADELGENFLTKPFTSGGESIRDGLKDIPYVVAHENNILGSNQSAQKVAIDKLKDVSSDLQQIKNWSDLKTVIQNMDDNIDWSNPEKSVSNEMLTQTRRKLDEFLKMASPEYADIMGPIADKTSQLHNLKKRFSLSQGAVNYTTSDKSVNAAKNLVDNMSREVSPQLKSDLGEKLRDEFDLANMYKRSKGDTGRGGRSVYWLTPGGFGVGNALGLDPVMSAFAGGTLGLVRDKLGRQIASNLLAFGSKPIKMVDKSLSKTLGAVDQAWDLLSEGQKKALTSASERGAQSFMVTWALMNKE